MSSDTKALEVTGLCKSFGAVVVAEDVTFSVTKGSAFGIIGPNGAGKTTLFNLVTGTLKADAGAVRLFGQDVSALSARARCDLGIARGRLQQKRIKWLRLLRAECLTLTGRPADALAELDTAAALEQAEREGAYWTVRATVLEALGDAQGAAAAREREQAHLGALLELEVRRSHWRLGR